MIRNLKKRILSTVCVTAMLTASFGDMLAYPVHCEDDFCHQNFELYPNGEEAEQTVILDGLMPQGATASAVDVTETFTPEETSVLSAYDITISDGQKEYQPDETVPVRVEIFDSQITENVELWHIKDDGQREQITDFKAEDGKIIFYATGFSIYAIVESDSKPEKYFQPLSSVAQLKEHADAGNGLYIQYRDKKYYLTSESVVSGSNTGIRTSKDFAQACKYYFENTSSSDYKIYCFDGTEKKYLKQSGASLLFVSEEEATVFTSTQKADKFKLNGFGWNLSGENVFASTNSSSSSIFQLLYDEENGQNDLYGLDGKSYGLMYCEDVSFGEALMADQALNHIPLSDILIRTDSSHDTYYLAYQSSATLWEFHCVSKNTYTLSASVNGVSGFLKLNADNSISFTTEESEATALKVSSRDEKLKFYTETQALAFDNEKFTVKSNTVNDDSVWLNLLELTSLSPEDYVTYAAKEISVSDVKNGESVIVYTRIWNDEDKKYHFYAVDANGSLVPCYERGDSIMWIGNQLNTLLWDFTEYYWENTNEPNNYYELYNPYSGKYIAPQIDGQQILSDNKIGINLNGRKFHEYYTDIIAWDSVYYTYAGLKADINSDSIISCQKNEAETFYFASVNEKVSELTPVQTIDNHDYNITMKMIDYPNRATQSNFLGNDETNYTNPISNLLATHLEENGYPMTTLTNKSLSELYSKATEVNHLFIQSTYEESGYFEFDSCQNFATLKPTDDGNFTVYKELGTTDGSVATTLKHGQFFPYDNITAGNYSVSNPENLFGATAQRNNDTVGMLPDSDPRKYERLYTVGTKPNYHNGMELSAEFTQTPNGCDAWGHDMIFEFTGDDDFWLYVDGELVIDLGGIHSALAGNVNFATGQVIVNGTKKTLRQIFQENYRKRNPNATKEEVEQYLSVYFNENEDIFKNYSSHEMKIFYMERGAGASNLHMRFNLSHPNSNQVILTKTVSGTEDLNFDLVEYPYQIWYIDREGEEKLLTNENGMNVTYQNSTRTVNYLETYTPLDSEQSYPSVYFISPRQSAEIHFPEDAVNYRITECSIDTEVYDSVKINDMPAMALPTSEDTARKNFDSGWLSITEVPNIVFDNHVKTDGLRTLIIKKNLYDEKNNPLTETADDTKFKFRLYLSNGLDDNLNLANMYPYRIKTPDGFYCRWDAEQQRFVSLGVSEWNALPQSVQKSATFETSMNGAISEIPVDYQIEIPNLPIGVKYLIEERDYEIPLGYQFVEYEHDSESYNIEKGDTVNSGTIRPQESPAITVRNKRGWGLSVNKVWNDSSHVVSHETIFIAVFLKDTLIDGTVRALNYPDTSLRYFFDNMAEGCSFEDYTVREVRLTNPSVDENGTVHYDELQTVNNGDSVSLKAYLDDSSEQDYSYTVSYETGTATGKVENVRSDLITNTRNGGIALYLYDMKTKEKLPNGEFTLSKDGNLIGTYTSNQDGRITILYDYEINANYTVTETTAPSGYIGLPNSAVFNISDTNIVSVSGNENSEPDIWEDVTQPPENDTLIAHVNFYNKPFHLSALKCDSDSGKELANAHFALYREVYSTLDHSRMKDYQPMMGYEDLVTGTDGMIPKIDNSLPAGTYYLTEISAPENYQGLEEDVIFTISPLGEITGNFLHTEKETNEILYQVRVPNKSTIESAELTIIKSVLGSLGDKSRNFVFTITVENSSPDGYYWTKNDVIQSKRIYSGDTFTLKDKESVMITLPKNATVTIKENNLKYQTTFQLNDGKAKKTNNQKFTLSENTTLKVTNTLDGVIATGVSSNLPAVIFMISGSAVLIFLILFKKKKHSAS